MSMFENASLLTRCRNLPDRMYSFHCHRKSYCNCRQRQVRSRQDTKGRFHSHCKPCLHNILLLAPFQEYRSNRCRIPAYYSLSLSFVPRDNCQPSAERGTSFFAEARFRFHILPLCDTRMDPNIRSDLQTCMCARTNHRYVLQNTPGMLLARNPQHMCQAHREFLAVIYRQTHGDTQFPRCRRRHSPLTICTGHRKDSRLFLYIFLYMNRRDTHRQALRGNCLAVNSLDALRTSTGEDTHSDHDLAQ